MIEGSFRPVSNKADWVQSIEVKDDDTGDLIDLSGITIIIEVRDPRSQEVVLTTSGNGTVVVLDLGVMQFTFLASQVRRICKGAYEIGGIFKRGSDTAQIIIGRVPIVDGIVQGLT